MARPRPLAFARAQVATLLAAFESVLLLADPLLSWPSERSPLDKLRPAPAFVDTGLLGHWGLRLEPPVATGPAERRVDGRAVRTLSPGTLAVTGPDCASAGVGLVARCRIGGGMATVIADSDFLQPSPVEGADAEANLALLLAELDRLEQ